MENKKLVGVADSPEPRSGGGLVLIPDIGNNAFPTDLDHERRISHEHFRRNCFHA